MVTTIIPRKRIISVQHLQLFIESTTFQQITTFIQQLNTSIIGVKLSEQVQLTQTVQEILTILDGVESILDQTPPIDNGASRFGNPAFRSLYDKVVEKSSQLHSTLTGLPDDKIQEVSAYFNESWGNRTRIDYGSGMELNFLCWLLCLNKLGLIDTNDKAIVTRVFSKYMSIARRLQTTYWLEPAGSHGAQGLDDYHFAVFIFGSAQLATHPHLRPKNIRDPELLEEFSKDYMYFDYVRYINSIKTASLRWHSPMLDDISSVKQWSKVNSGMLKMYEAEVLCKLPVAQHFLFGSLVPFPESMERAIPIMRLNEPCIASPTSPSSLSANLDGTRGGEAGGKRVHTDEEGHLHIKGEGFGDCCGIPIPSRFAAMELERKKEFGAGARRIPFD